MQQKQFNDSKTPNNIVVSDTKIPSGPLHNSELEIVELELFRIRFKDAQGHALTIEEARMYNRLLMLRDRMRRKSASR